MIRRSPLRSTLLIATVAMGLSACGTFTDDNVAARVNDVELSDDQLEKMLRASTPEETTQVPLEIATQTLTLFVQDAVLRADLARLGVTPPAMVEGERTPESIQADFQASFAEWQTTAPGDVDASVWAASYSRGPIESGIVCTSHVLLASEQEALDVLATLDDGVSFSDLAVERSIDPGSGAEGGIIPCSSAGQFANTFIQEYVAAAFDAEIGVPVGPVESQFGHHVILVRPFAEIAQTELDQLLSDPAIRFDLATQEYDVYVDPRYGSFNGAAGVLPLG